MGECNQISKSLVIISHFPTLLLIQVLFEFSFLNITHFNYPLRSTFLKVHSTIKPNQEPCIKTEKRVNLYS